MNLVHDTFLFYYHKAFAGCFCRTYLLCKRNVGDDARVASEYIMIMHDFNLSEEETPAGAKYSQLLEGELRTEREGLKIAIYGTVLSSIIFA